MKKIIFVLGLLLFVSCQKKEIKIPTLEVKGIQEVFDHSQVWIFFENKKNDTIAVVNRKNTISSTHWIYNIDKRLPLKTFITTITELQNKHSNSIHSKKGMHDYFSYSDTISKKLSFIAFDLVQFKTDSLLSKFEIKQENTIYKNFNNINLTFNPSYCLINDTKVSFEEFKTTLIEFVEFTSEGKKTMLHLNFNENLTYQNYLFYKTMLIALSSPSIQLNQIEYIFNQKKVSDCAC